MVVSKDAGRNARALQGGKPMMPGPGTDAVARVAPVVFWPRYRPPVTRWAYFFSMLVTPLRALIGPWLSKKLANLILKVRRPATAHRHQMAGQTRGVEPTHAQVDAYLRVEAAKIGINPEELQISHFLLRTEEGANLDSIALSLVPATQCTKATLVLTGNTVRYEHDYALNALLDELKTADGGLSRDRRVVAFSYPTVGNSSGPLRNFASLIESARAQAADLLGRHRIAASELTINAHSLGAMIGTTVAAELHDANQPVRFIHDRSGSSFTQIVVGYVWEYFDWRNLRRVGQVLSEIARPIIWALVRLGRWEIDVATPFLRIPATHTHLSTLRSSREDRDFARSQGQRRGDDRNIVHYATVYHAIKHQVQRGLRFSRHTLKAKIRGLLANQQVTPEQYRQFKEDLRTPKFIALDRTERDAHGRRRQMLRSRNRNLQGDNFYEGYLHFRDGPPSNPQKQIEENLGHLLDSATERPRPPRASMR